MQRVLALLAGAVLAGALAGAPRASRAAASPQFLYVHDDGAADRIFGFRLGGTGALTPLTGSPFPMMNSSTECQGPCQTLAFSSRRRLLFTTGHFGLSVFQVAANGVLSEVGPPVGAAVFLGVAVVERGSKTFVYAAQVDADQIRGFEAQAGGSLVELATSPFPAGENPAGMSATKDLLFAANSNVPVLGGDTISAFKVAMNGSLAAAPGSPFGAPASEPEFQTVNVEPQGRFVYAADASLEEPFIFGWRVNMATAALTALPGSPFDDGLDESNGGLAVSNSPILFAFRFVGFPDEPDDIQAMRRKGNGKLVQLGPVQNAGLLRADGSALTANGKILAVASSGSDQVRSFSVNQSTGVLTVADTEPAALADDQVTGVIVARP
jgi:6-phosphogluconolactonase (cycloisomerase 2 family)